MPKWLLRWFSSGGLNEKDEHEGGIESTLTHPKIIDKRKNPQPIEAAKVQGDNDPYIANMLAAALQDESGEGVIGSIDKDGKLTIRNKD